MTEAARHGRHTALVAGILVILSCASEKITPFESRQAANATLHDIQLSLAHPVNPDVQDLFDLVISTPRSAAAVAICFAGQATSCNPQTDAQVQTTLIYGSGQRRFFKTDAPVAVADNLSLELLAYNRNHHIVGMRSVTFALKDGDLIMDPSSPAGPTPSTPSPTPEPPAPLPPAPEPPAPQAPAPEPPAPLPSAPEPSTPTPATPSGPQPPAPAPPAPQPPAPPSPPPAPSPPPPPPPVMAPPQASTFTDNNPDGWMCVGDPDSAVPLAASVDSPEGTGRIRCVDAGKGLTSYFRAPSKFGGNRLGQVLSFHLGAAPAAGKPAEYFSNYDVVIQGAGIILGLNRGFTPTSNWSYYEVRLTNVEYWEKLSAFPSAGGPEPTKAKATNAEVEAALSDITRLEIRSEFLNGGGDKGWLSAPKVK